MIIFCPCKNLLNNKKAKNIGGRNSSSKLTLKTKWYYSCGCNDDSQSCEQLEKHVTVKYFAKKSDFNPNHLPLQENYVTITKVE